MTLLQQLEAAGEGSYALDTDVHVALNLIRPRLDGLAMTTLPPVTTSLDAALALAERVLPGWRFVFATNTPPWVQAYPPGSVEDCLDAVAASTLPLALCAAIIRAKEMK